MIFNERLKSLRTEKGITQEELANRLNLPQSTIRRYESGNTSLPKHERLKLLADFFNCSVDYLLGRSDSADSLNNEDDLTDEEKKFISIFRNLEKDDKQYLSGLMERIQKK